VYGTVGLTRSTQTRLLLAQFLALALACCSAEHQRAVCYAFVVNATFYCVPDRAVAVDR
jgi:hypothetical protein